MAETVYVSLQNLQIPTISIALGLLHGIRFGGINRFLLAWSRDSRGHKGWFFTYKPHSPDKKPEKNAA
jgi:hypothetical protein